jgi:hypothetical protein
MAQARLHVTRGSVDYSASTTEKQLERVRSSFGTGRDPPRRTRWLEGFSDAEEPCSNRPCSRPSESDADV